MANANVLTKYGILNHLVFLRKGMSRKYKLLFYLKLVYVGLFSLKTADWIIENAEPFSARRR